MSAFFACCSDTWGIIALKLKMRTDFFHYIAALITGCISAYQVLDFYSLIFPSLSLSLGKTKCVVILPGIRVCVWNFILQL